MARPWITELLRRHWFYLLLQTISTAFAMWWIPYGHLPLPGYAIAGVAVLAAVMSVHLGMRPWQKVIWILLIGSFLITELRAIRKDRVDTNNQFVLDRATQEHNFSLIRSAQDADFRATAAALESAITGIQSTLHTTSQTFEQTKPHALFGQPQFDIGHATISRGTHFTYNVYALNIGSETAKNVQIFSSMYLGVPDDEATEKHLYVQFENDWEHRKVGSSDLSPGSPASFRTFDSPTFTLPEMKQIGTSQLTLYIFSRIAYSDSGGEWYSDACENLQVPIQKMGAPSHQCSVRFNNKRYKPKLP